ncbi:four helix bundle protein [Haloferula sp.]|uniref:four helix bundle protein n=1 Tax=Haloferula sp. TaxID=2497595 RepID=UPI0032A05A94
MADDQPQYDLEERTFEFALALRKVVQGHRWNRAQWSDINQVLRSSGSVAANYVEANNAASKADFKYRIGVSKKEGSETKLWLRLLGSTSTTEDAKADLRRLFKEADELVRIFAKIHSSCGD